MKDYDFAAGELARTDHVADTSRDLYVAIRRARLAGKDARHALKRIDADKRTGKWTAGLHYQLASGQVLDEKQFVAGLASLRDRAHATQHGLIVRLAQAFHREYPGASRLQLAELAHFGPPLKVATIDLPKTRSKHHHHGHGAVTATCWMWSTRHAYVATCWNPDRTVALRHTWSRKEIAAAGRSGNSGAVAAAGGGDSDAGSSIESSSGDLAASDTAATDSSEADPEAAGGDSSGGTADGASDSGSSESASNDSGSSDGDSGSSDSGSSDSASDSGSSDSGSSDSGSSDSGASDSGESSAAPEAPATPACSPDGTNVMTWSNCCSGRAILDSDAGTMTCCSSGPNCD